MLTKAVADGGSTYISSLYLAALTAAIRLHEEAGFKEDADRWRPLANRVRIAVHDLCWDKKQRLFAESPELIEKPVSQHSQVQPILAGAATQDQISQITSKLFTDAVSGFMLKPYGYYLARALEQTGHYEEFSKHQLEDYRQMMVRHLTTWQEGDEPGRSDCHAWSSWPAVDFLTAVLGIKPLKPGFEVILVKPQFIYEYAKGQMPTVQGMVKVDWKKVGKKIEIDVEGPKGIPVTVQLLKNYSRLYPNGGRIHVDI